MKTLINILIFIGINSAAFGQAVPSVEWQKSIGGSMGDDCYGIAQSPDGTFGVAGNTGSSDGDVSGHFGYLDILVAKLDINGDTLWVKTLGGSSYDAASGIIANWDEGYTILGFSSSTDGDVTGNFDPNNQNDDFWVVRLSNTGSIIWEKSYGGENDDDAFAIAHTQDGGYILTGFTTSEESTGYHGGRDVWVVKIDSTGTTQWEKSYGGSGDEIGNSIIQTADGDYVVAGSSTSSNNGDVSVTKGYGDYWIFKIDNTGNLIWEKTYGGSDSYGDFAQSIIQTADGGYAVAGYTGSNDGDVTGLHGGTNYEDFWVLKLDPLGNLQWQKTYGGTGDDYAYSIIQTNDSGYLVAGGTGSFDDDVTNNTSYQEDAWVIKISDLGVLQWNLALGGSDESEALSMISTMDGGFALAGDADQNGGIITGNHGLDDFWIVKLGFPTGINEIDGQTNLSIYPNPATNQLFVSSKNEAIQDISLFTIAGKEVLNQTILPEFENKQNVLLDVSSLPSGVYLLKATTAKGVLTRKWIKV